MAKKGRIQKKNKQREEISRPVRYKKYKQFFLIVCEDKKTEPYYFSKFKSLFPEQTLFLETVGTGRDPLGVVQTAIQARTDLRAKTLKEIDFVWAVFDIDDAHLYPNRTTRFNTALTLANNNNICVAPSNEVFELWLLLHFVANIAPNVPIPRAQIYLDLQGAIQALPSYSGYTYVHGDISIIDIVEELGDEGLAMTTALTLDSIHENVPILNSNPRTKIYLLVKELREWIDYYNWTPD